MADPQRQQCQPGGRLRIQPATGRSPAPLGPRIGRALEAIVGLGLIAGGCWFLFGLAVAAIVAGGLILADAAVGAWAHR